MNESTTILKVLPNPPPPGFATAAAAIAGAKAMSSHYLGEIGFAEVIGRAVDAVGYDDGSFVWRLIGNKTLTIIANQDGSGVSASIAGAGTPRHAGVHRGVVQIESGSQSWNWDRDEVPRSVVGASISYGSFDGHNFYVYLDSRCIVSFGCLLIQESQAQLLYWQFSD